MEVHLWEKQDIREDDIITAHMKVKKREKAQWIAIENAS